MAPRALIGWTLALAVLAAAVAPGVYACAADNEAAHTDGDVLAHSAGDGCAALAAASSAGGRRVAPPTVNADTLATEQGLFHYGMPGPFYGLAQFPAFRKLLDAWEVIRDEAVAITPRLDLLRRQDEWSGSGDGFLARLVQAENRGWTTAWDGEGLWLNYALSYFDNIVPGVTEAWAPQTVALLRQLPGIRIGGFSRLLPGAYIAPHTDSTGPQFHSMAFHLCLRGRASLRVGDHWVEQAPGRVLIFDSTQTHEVINSDDDRIVLYIDFDIDAFLRGTEGVEPAAAAVAAEE
jgi:hypothetical protein